MPLSVLAQAELSIRWDELPSRCARALAAVDTRWIEPFAYPDATRHEAALDLGPADPLTISFGEGLLTVHARTSTFGPGYHRRVIEVLDALEAALGRWQRVVDPTGFYRRRDPDELERAFLSWARSLWAATGECALLRGARVGLAVGAGPADVPPGRVATPTGFKDAAWVERVRVGLEAALRAPQRGRAPPPAAREAFLWWHALPDAFDWVQLGRAICVSDVIWRPEARGDPLQREVRQRAADCFERALLLDPEAPVPTPELRRLYELLDRPDEALRVAARVRRPASPFEGGYREGWIRCPLAGRWNLLLPGWLQARCDDADGHDVFWDERMTVHVTAIARAPRRFVPRAAAERHLALLAPEARRQALLELIDNGAAQGYAVLHPLRSAPGTSVVQGVVARGQERVAFTILVRSPEACPLALRLGRSLVPLPRRPALPELA